MFTQYTNFEKRVRLELYNSWVERHFEKTIKRSAFLAAISMTVVVILDPLLFADALRYAPLQLTATLLYIFAVIATTPLAAKFSKIVRQSETVLWFPHLFVSLVYLYFLKSAPELESWIVLAGTFMILFFTQMAVYEFRKSSTILLMGTLLGIGASVINETNRRSHDSFMLLLIFAVVTWVFFARKRWEFVKNLSEKHKILSNIFPPNEAKLICVANDDVEFTGLFAPRMRPAVCLSTDWRGYQQLANRLDPQHLSKTTDQFCELVVNTLEELDPHGTHYITWVADLLFIIFYDQNDELKNAIDRAIKFTNVYCTRIFDKSRKEIFEGILFDVGLSAGEGLLGLQGARSIKKTTITSPHAGTANRLEREAKRLREKNSNIQTPIVCIDSTIRQHLINNEQTSFASVIAINVEESDLKNGDKFYRWDYNSRQSTLVKFSSDLDDSSISRPIASNLKSNKHD